MSRFGELFGWATKRASHKPEPCANVRRTIQAAGVTSPGGENPAPCDNSHVKVTREEPRTQESEATVPPQGRRRQLPKEAPTCKERLQVAQKNEQKGQPCPVCSLFGWVVGGTPLEPLAVPCEPCKGTGRIPA